eukprot:149197-Hanusia_phi.AAC.4
MSGSRGGGAWGAGKGHDLPACWRDLGFWAQVVSRSRGTSPENEGNRRVPAPVQLSDQFHADTFQSLGQFLSAIHFFPNWQEPETEIYMSDNDEGEQDEECREVRGPRAGRRG